MAIVIDDFAGRRVHMIGVGGSSMSGLAGLLRQRGYEVTGRTTMIRTWSPPCAAPAFP